MNVIVMWNGASLQVKSYVEVNHLAFIWVYNGRKLCRKIKELSSRVRKKAQKDKTE